MTALRAIDCAQRRRYCWGPPQQVTLLTLAVLDYTICTQIQDAVMTSVIETCITAPVVAMLDGGSCVCLQSQQTGTAGGKRGLIVISAQED